jgi:peptidyl-prolyl cis-trans isomerase A (cyclophilin A)/peptidyl-prolyl cis-trans isomerase B (cyclophilin B)
MFKHTLIALVATALAPFAFAQQAAPAKPAPKPAVKAAEAAKGTTTDMVATAANPKAILHTNMGDITIELYPDKAPKTVDNFEQYVKDGFYDGTVFHRVIPTFMIQGGGWTKELQRKRTRAPIRNEANNGLSNVKYSVAMARTSDPHSAAAEFFINTVDNKRLDYTGDTNSLTWGYCVFGKVVAGQDVVDKIKAVPTGPGGPLQSDVPQTPVVIDKAEMAP